MAGYEHGKGRRTWDSEQGKTETSKTGRQETQDKEVMEGEVTGKGIQSKGVRQIMRAQAEANSVQEKIRIAKE